MNQSFKNIKDKGLLHNPDYSICIKYFKNVYNKEQFKIFHNLYGFLAKLQNSLYKHS